MPPKTKKNAEPIKESIDNAHIAFIELINPNDNISKENCPQLIINTDCRLDFLIHITKVNLLKLIIDKINVLQANSDNINVVNELNSLKSSLFETNDQYLDFIDVSDKINVNARSKGSLIASQVLLSRRAYRLIRIDENEQIKEWI